MYRAYRRTDRLTFVAVGKFPVVIKPGFTAYGVGYTFLFRKRGSEKAVHPSNLCLSLESFTQQQAVLQWAIGKTPQNLSNLLPLIFTSAPAHISGS